MNSETYYKPQLVAVRRTTWWLGDSETPTGVREYWKERELDPKTSHCDAIEFEFSRIPKSKWTWEGSAKQKEYIRSTIHGMEYMLCNKGYLGMCSSSGLRHTFKNYRVDPRGYSLEDCFASQDEMDLHLIVTVWPIPEEEIILNENT